MRPITADVPCSVSVSVCLLNTAMNCAKTAEPIEMPFVMWTPMSRGNHVLSGDPDLPGKWAIWGGAIWGQRALCCDASFL